MKNKIMLLYEKLFGLYMHQGWWPLLDCEHLGVNPTKTGSMRGYHPNDYSYPKNDKQRFEICIGAILTQNTSWQNVEKALRNLYGEKLLDAKKILKTSDEKISLMIKPSGYFNQKTKKLKKFSKFYVGLKGRAPSREELLDVWGVGPETADSILLYAYNIPSFVVDAYTRRILIEMKIIKKDVTYDSIKRLFEKNISKDYKVYQEYHALLVEHAKRIRNKS